MSKKVVMLVTNEYGPDPRVHKEAKALVDGGYEVVVVAWDRMGRRPIFEEIEGVKVARVRTGQVRGQLALVLNYPVFLLKALRAIKDHNPEAVHAHDLDTLPIGVLAARLRSIPLVFDAHERYSKMIAVDVPEFISRLVQRIENILAPFATQVITINEVMAKDMRLHAKDEVLVIMNCVELAPPSRMRDHQPSENLILLNPVTFEPMRYIVESLQAVGNIPNCTLRIAGTGRLKADVERLAQELDNVEYLGFLPLDRMLDEYTRADVVLLLADPRNENYRTGTANKMGEAMAFGLPLITTKGTLSGEIIEGVGCGIAIDWSEENFRGAVERLRDHDLRKAMGLKGRQAAEAEYNWGIMRSRLQKAYNKMIGKSDR